MAAPARRHGAGALEVGVGACVVGVGAGAFVRVAPGVGGAVVAGAGAAGVGRSEA